MTYSTTKIPTQKFESGNEIEYILANVTKKSQLYEKESNIAKICRYYQLSFFELQKNNIQFLSISKNYYQCSTFGHFY